jgi:hypothetical protein
MLWIKKHWDADYIKKAEMMIMAKVTLLLLTFGKLPHEICIILDD